MDYSDNLPTNTPIEELIKQYEREECDFDDVSWMVEAANRYVMTMDDSQVRCLLHAMAVRLGNLTE